MFSAPLHLGPPSLFSKASRDWGPAWLTNTRASAGSENQRSGRTSPQDFWWIKCRASLAVAPRIKRRSVSERAIKRTGAAKKKDGRSTRSDGGARAANNLSPRGGGGYVAAAAGKSAIARLSCGCHGVAIKKKQSFASLREQPRHSSRDAAAFFAIKPSSQTDRASLR